MISSSFSLSARLLQLRQELCASNTAVYARGTVGADSHVSAVFKVEDCSSTILSRIGPLVLELISPQSSVMVNPGRFRPVCKRGVRTIMNCSPEDAFRLFSQSAYAAEVVDSKTTHLVKLAAAMSMGCYP